MNPLIISLLDIFLCSYYFSAWYCVDIVRRDSASVTHGSELHVWKMQSPSFPHNAISYIPFHLNKVRKIGTTINKYFINKWIICKRSSFDDVLKSANISIEEMGIGVFGFAVLAIFRPAFWFLCQKLRFFGFTVHFGLWIWFSVFIKNANGFSDLISDVVFCFSYLTYLGSSFSSIWAAIACLHWSWIAAKCKCYRKECMKNQLKYRRYS